VCSLVTYTYTLSLTSVLDDGQWSTSHSDRFTPPPAIKTRNSMYRRPGGLQGRNGRMRKIKIQSIYIFIYLFIYYSHYIRWNGAMREEAVVVQFSLLSWNLYEGSEEYSDPSQGSRCCSCD